MSAVLEQVVPVPHHHLSTSHHWASSSDCNYIPPSTSPAPMTPESMTSYAPHLQDSPLAAHQVSGVASSTWFAPPVTAPVPQHDLGTYPAYAYTQPYVAPPSGTTHYPRHSPFSQAQDLTSTAPAMMDATAGSFSPVSQASKTSEVRQPDFVRPPGNTSPHAAVSHLPCDHAPIRPHSQPTDVPGWSMNPLGISTPTMSNHFFSNSPYASLRDRSPCLSEPAMDLPGDLSSSQPRRLYAPIAPHPSGARTSAPKRSREDDEDCDQAKRRKRSDSNTSATIELGEEDRLLIQLKDEESMPWKDIAARFQSDLGKTYQIPALQMRLKRLRERMRVWTEVDVKALRMAHEYWVQSKFDIIAQKMLEYGAAEKWTARQCARKWAEIDPGPTPYTTYEHHVPNYAPYSMSPVEAHHFMPYVHIQ